jgi:hypothetical protein
MIKILFYISNHGFGHATRMYALATEFSKLGIISILSTNRNKNIFQGFNEEYLIYREKSIDCEISHYNWQTPNIKQIRENLTNFFLKKDDLIKDEVNYIKQEKITFIIADIPFMAFQIAKTADIPACGISNFDWLEQYRYFLKDYQDSLTTNILKYIDNSYKLAKFALLLPFSGNEQLQGMSSFNYITKTALLARKTLPNRNKILKDFNISKEKKIILLSFTDKHNFKFDNILKNDNIVLLSKDTINHPNFRHVPENYDYQFLLASVDAIITKSGYSTLSEACQHKKIVFYLKRNEFAEDQLLSLQLQQYPYAYPIYSDNNEIEITFNKLFEIQNKKVPKIFNNANTQVALDTLTGYFKIIEDSSKLNCIIEIGTNNILLLITQIENNQQYKIIHRASFVTEMGKNFKNHYLSNTAISRTKKVLTNIFSILDTSMIKMHIIGTWICREAINITILSEWLKINYNTSLKIISKDEECFFNSISLLNSFKEYNNILAFDIGGGSTEIIIIKNRKVIFQKSTNLGIRNIHNQFKNDEIQIHNHIIKILKSLDINLKDLQNIKFIGIGGIFTSIYSVINQIEIKNLNSAHKSVLRFNEIESILNNFNINSYKQFNNYHKQLQIMQIGLSIVKTIMLFFKIEQFIISDRSPQFGYFEKLISE